MNKAERKAFEAGFKAAMKKKADAITDDDPYFFDDIYAKVYEYMCAYGSPRIEENRYVLRSVYEDLLEDITTVLMRARLNAEQDLLGEDFE